jgi:hypothetical protein
MFSLKRLSRKVLLLPLVIGLPAFALASCSSGPPNRVQEKPTTAGGVALAFSKALWSDEIAQATRLVLPSSRSIVKIFSANIGSSSVQSKNLKVGSIHYQDPNAIVVLVGTLCSTGSEESLPSKNPEKYCKTNTNPHLSSTLFEVRVKKVNGRGWFVNFKSN